MSEKGVNSGVNNAIKSVSDAKKLDVELTTEGKLEDPAATRALLAAAEAMKQGFATHKASFAVHVYVSDLSRELYFVTQCHGPDLPENVASLANTDLALRMREYYNPEYKQRTRNKLDKR